MALRVRYENGQSEDIAIARPQGEASVTEAPRTEPQRNAHRIAKGTLQVMKHIYAAHPDEMAERTAAATSALGHAASVLPEIDEKLRRWRYPVNPDDVDVVLQQSMRKTREATRRFVQASGTLARIIGGQLRTADGDSPALSYFAEVVPAPNEKEFDPSERFCYDLLRAILLWLDGGPGAVVRGFIHPTDRHVRRDRYPLTAESTIADLDDLLVPYLLRLASDRPVPNVDVSRFEVESNQVVFSSEKGLFSLSHKH